jgi:predicted TIM-barrel fold metal-dependent hydrolase
MADDSGRRRRRRRADWEPRFLELFRQTANVRLSADGAGIDRGTAYHRRQRDEAFAAAWAQAEADAIDVLEAEARRRALSVSDNLLMFLLKAHRPDRFRETIRIDIRREAERLAAELGIDAEEAIAEAERIVARVDR